jgi:hypothetical protein
MAGHAMNAPTPIPTNAEAIHNHDWWDAESRRLGTDWNGLIATHLHVLAVLNLIEPAPSSFELACKRANDFASRKRGRR